MMPDCPPIGRGQGHVTHFADDEARSAGRAGTSATDVSKLPAVQDDVR